MIRDSLNAYLFFLLFLIFFQVFPSLSYAEKTKGVNLGTVIVTDDDKLNYQTGDVRSGEDSSFSSVITRDRFEGRVEDLSEIIEKEAGIQVRQAGGLGSFSTVSLRGCSSDQVLIFIDGILLNKASGGGVDLSNIALDDVEAVEVYRGATPINFGTASIGGVVNIRTRRSKKNIRANLSVGYGSFNTWKSSVFLSHKPGAWDYLVSGDFLGSNSDFRFKNNNGTDNNESDDRWENRNNSQFLRANLLTKFGYDFTGDVRLDLSNQFFRKKQGLPNWNNSENVNAELTSDRDIGIVKVVVNDISPLHLNSAVRLQYSVKNETYDDRNGSIGLGKQHLKYKTFDYGFNEYLELPTEHNIFSMVLDFRREYYETENLLDKENYHPSFRNTFSGALEDNIILFDESLIISPSVRYHYVIDELKSGVNPLNKRSESKGYFSPKAGVKYTPFSWISIKSNCGSYVREPSFLELFGDRGFFLGNPELLAEKGMNFDVGFELEFKSRKGFVKRLSLKSACFRSDIENVITFMYDARGIGKAINIEAAAIQGVESSFALDILRHVSFSGNYTWQLTENKSKIKPFNGKRLPGRFEHSFFGKAELKGKPGVLYVEGVYESGMFYDDANLLRALDKKEYNFGASVNIYSFTFTIEVKNILNNYYEDFNGYPQPGRAYYATLKYVL